jgi:hypothetical protein
MVWVHEQHPHVDAMRDVDQGDRDRRHRRSSPTWCNHAAEARVRDLPITLDAPPG